MTQNDVHDVRELVAQFKPEFLAVFGGADIEVLSEAEYAALEQRRPEISYFIVSSGGA